MRTERVVVATGDPFRAARRASLVHEHPPVDVVVVADGAGAAVEDAEADVPRSRAGDDRGGRSPRVTVRGDLADRVVETGEVGERAAAVRLVADVVVERLRGAAAERDRSLRRAGEVLGRR